MKKIFLFILVMNILFVSTVKACDICGCGVSNIYIGILPQFNHKFFGLRYQFSSFRTRLLDDPTQFSKDFYQTVELWGGWNIGKRIQVLGFIPYNFNYQNSDEGITHRSGLGDVTFLANYKVFDVRSLMSNNKTFSQQLWIGGGLKLPTGKFVVDPSDPDVAAIANGQLGSGSTDYLLNTMYNIRMGSFGINTSANYKINSTNKTDFKFGNRVSFNGFGYYAIHVARSATISPNLGLLYQHTKPSVLQDQKIDLTGGYILNGSVGTEFSIRKVAFGFSVQLPIRQNFAENQTREKLKGMVHITLAI